jgi:hypothetical protein
MLDAEPAQPLPKTKLRIRPEDRDPDTTQHFFRQADKMAAAILKGNYEWAARLAREYQNARRTFNVHCLPGAYVWIEKLGLRKGY